MGPESPAGLAWAETFQKNMMNSLTTISPNPASFHPLPNKENYMSNTWEHHHHAARHHEKAAYHHKEAAKYDRAEEHEKAAHYAYLAHGHSQQAVHHEAEAAKLHAEECASPVTPASAQTGPQKTAA
jgi:hypothetical protein